MIFKWVSWFPWIYTKVGWEFVSLNTDVKMSIYIQQHCSMQIIVDGKPSTLAKEVYKALEYNKRLQML